MAAIERLVFADPWSARAFAECLAADALFLVADVGGIVAGYVIAQGAAGQGEILNLGVAPAHRRRGIGRRLVAEILARLRERGVHDVYLEVRESNTVARRLYESFGFREIGRRRRYYRRPVEDAVVLWTAIPAAGASAKL